MDREESRELAAQIRPLLLKRIDFKNGIVQEMTEEALERGRILDIRWKGNVHLILQMYRQNFGWYFAEKNDEKVSCLYRVNRFDERFYRTVQHLIDEINYGDFVHKQTVNEKIAKIIDRRQLTSYMNHTKWMEFLHVMTEEMPVQVPYAYHTLFDEDEENDDLFDTCYCPECFNGYHFKSLEWVKVKPKFCERKHRGRLVDDEVVWYDFEDKLIERLKEHSIPYVVKDGIYTIYGYR